MRVGIFGLGEAGSEIAADLATAGVAVRAFDPAPVPTPPGVERVAHPGGAVARAEVVMSVTAAADAAVALHQALTEMAPATHYADLATGPPDLKRRLGAVASASGLVFTDVALMGAVPGRGIRTPALASGPGAAEFAERMRTVGMEVGVVGEEPGHAATHKLLRSVFVKGLAAVLLESTRAAAAAGLGDETWATIVNQVEAADEAFLVRLLDGTATHARRRRDEMEAAVALLVELGVPATMTRSTVASLEAEIDQGGFTP